MAVDDDFGVRREVPELGDDVVGELGLTGGAEPETALGEQQVTGFDERTLCLQRCDLCLELVVLGYHRII